MSVINQVLNELEQRGAYTAADQPMVRAVLNSKRGFRMPLLVVGLVLIVGIAAWQWTQSSQPKVQAGDVAPKVNTPLSTNELEQLNPQGQLAAETVAPIVDVVAEEPPVKRLAPASRLSFELSSVPLPSRSPVKPIQSVISSVNPNPVIAAGVSQPLVINGSNFVKGSTVTLRASDGQVYAKRPISSQNATQIVINPNLGKSPDTWTVEVINSSGAPSDRFTFKVQTLTAEAKQNIGQSSTISAKGTSKADNLLSSGTKMTPPTDASVLRTSEVESKPMKQVSLVQQADAEFRRAAGLMQQGRIADAIAGYEAALRLDAGHDAARQALVALLLESKRNADAEKVLLEGLNNKPKNTAMTMLLARLQVERGALEQATATLEKSLPFADDQTDYRAFLAALLQRQNRNEEAVSHYKIVAQRAPNNGVWLMGYGISLQALQRNAEAKDVFQRSLDTKTLGPELQAFVQQKLKGL